MSICKASPQCPETEFQQANLLWNSFLIALCLKDAQVLHLRRSDAFYHTVVALFFIIRNIRAVEDGSGVWKQRVKRCLSVLRWNKSFHQFHQISKSSISRTCSAPLIACTLRGWFCHSNNHLEKLRNVLQTGLRLFFENIKYVVTGLFCYFSRPHHPSHYRNTCDKFRFFVSDFQIAFSRVTSE